MADQTTTVIIDVNLNSEQARQRATELSQRIVVLRDAQDQLRSSGLQLGNTYRENAQELRTLESETRAYLNISRNAEGSVNSLRAQIIVLNNQFNALSRTERDSTVAGRALTTQLAALRAEERAVSQSTGNFSTNIGNYIGAISQAAGLTGGFGSSLIGLASSANSLTGAFAGVSASLGVLKTALLTSGIGAIILLLAALGTYLKDVDTVADETSIVFARSRAAFVEFGRSILDLDFSNLNSRLKEAAKNAGEVTEAMQTLEDSVLSQSVKSADAQAEIAQKRAQALNKSLTGPERQKLLADAEALDKQDLDARQRLADQRIKIAQNDIIATGHLRDGEIKQLKERGVEAALEFQNQKVTQGRVTDDQTKTLQKALLERTAIQNEYTQRSERRNNLSERIALQQQQQEKARQSEIDKINADRVKSELDVAQSVLTIRQKEFSDINADIDKRKKAYEKYGQDTTQLELERVTRISVLAKKFREQDTDTIQGNIRSATNIRNSSTSDPRAKKQAQLDTQSVFDLQDVDKQIDLVHERIDKGEQGLTELLQSYINKRLEIVAKANEDQAQIDQDYRDQQRQREQDAQAADFESKLDEIDREGQLNDQRLAINESLANSYSNLANSIATAFGKQTTLGKVALAAQKAFAIAEIIINAEREKSAIAVRYAILEAQAALIPYAGAFLVAALEAAKAVEVTTVTIREIASVGAVAATFFARGGYVSGPGTGTSDSIPAMLSNGETVINAKATKMFGPLLSDMNVAGGGVAFATGGTAGSYIPNISQQVNGGNALAQAVIAGVSTLRPIVYVDDINYKQNQAAVNVENATW